MKNSSFKYLTILVFISTFIFFSCKERTKYNNVGQVDLESVACDSIKDITAAFPIIKNYKDYKLVQVGCLSDIRYFNLTYLNSKDTLSRMDISVRDGRLSGNEIFLLDIKNTFDTAKRNYGKTYMSKLIGEFGSVHIYDSGNLNYNANFNCILKSNYAVNIRISKNKKLGTQNSLELFLKDYISKIDVSKLK